MSGKNKIYFHLFCLCIFIQACAQPKYENIIQNPGTQSTTSTQEKTSNCPIKFKNSGLCLQWNWETKPTESSVGSLVFKTYRGNLYDDSILPMDLPLEPQVILWMPDMGHGSSPTTVLRLDVGTYRALNVFFVMPGDWEIKFQIKKGNEVVDEAVISISI